MYLSKDFFVSVVSAARLLEHRTPLDEETKERREMLPSSQNNGALAGGVIEPGCKLFCFPSPVQKAPRQSRYKSRAIVCVFSAGSAAGTFSRCESEGTLCRCVAHSKAWPCAELRALSVGATGLISGCSSLIGLSAGGRSEAPGTSLRRVFISMQFVRATKLHFS